LKLIALIVNTFYLLGLSSCIDAAKQNDAINFMAAANANDDKEICRGINLKQHRYGTNSDSKDFSSTIVFKLEGVSCHYAPDPSGEKKYFYDLFDKIQGTDYADLTAVPYVGFKNQSEISLAEKACTKFNVDYNYHIQDNEAAGLSYYEDLVELSKEAELFVYITANIYTLSKPVFVDLNCKKFKQS